MTNFMLKNYEDAQSVLSNIINTPLRMPCVGEAVIIAKSLLILGEDAKAFGCLESITN